MKMVIQWNVLFWKKVEMSIEKLLFGNTMPNIYLFILFWVSDRDDGGCDFLVVLLEHFEGLTKDLKINASFP